MEKEKKKVPAKDKWEIPNIIPLISIVGINCRITILHMSKIMVHCYTTDENIHQSSIHCMINPSLKFNNALKTQVEECLSVSFFSRIMKTIENNLMKNNTYFIILIMIYQNNGEITKRLYRVLRCVVYSLIDNYFCIEYLSCQSKMLSDISCNPTFEDMSFNISLGIGITSLLLNLVSCHGSMKKKDSTVILNFRTCLINNYLSKEFLIIEQGTNQLIFLPNDVIFQINLNNHLNTYYVMVKNKVIFAVANTIKQLHIHKNMHIIYNQDFYKTKEKNI